MGDYGPLPTLLSSNRQMELDRESAKAGIEKRQTGLAKSWNDEQHRINEAMGSSALAKARIKASSDRLAAYGNSNTSILSPVNQPGNSLSKETQYCLSIQSRNRSR